MRASKGFRSGTRRKLSVGKRKKFKPEAFIKELKEGQAVVIKQDPSSHRGMPHPRFKGLTGTVKGKRGSSYIISVRSGRSFKEVIARPEHVKPLEAG